MAIAHVCIQCGHDLARIRPHREPHYNLPLIICPRCQHACVRWVHPIRRRWRDMMRVSSALMALGGHVLVLSILALLNVLAVYQLAGRARYLTPMQLMHDHYAVLALCLLSVPIATGVWLALGFRHLRWWKVGASWFVFIAILCTAEIFIDWAASASGSRGPLGSHEIRGWWWRIAVVGLVMVISSGGIPIASMLMRALPYIRRVRWRKRRKRLRNLRTPV